LDRKKITGMSYIKLSCLLIVFSSWINGHSQNAVMYTFKAENAGKGGNNDTSIYYGKEFEFKVKRIYKEKDYFIEQNLFSGRNKWEAGSSDTFKIKDGTWFLLHRGKWEYFFSDKGFAGKRKTIVNIAQLDYYLVPVKKVISDGRVLYVLQTIPVEKNSKVSSAITYFFDPKSGVIKISTSNVTLIKT